MIIKFKKAQLKSILLLSIFVIILSMMVYAVTVRINAPKDGVWETDNSIDHNFTIWTNGTLETIDYCTLYSNESGSWVFKANYTTDLANNTDFVRGVAWSDTQNNTIGWNISCFNGTEFSIDTAVFGVDGNSPTITLDTPDDSSFTNVNNSALKYTPTDSSNPETCLFYINISGTFAINQTNNSFVSGVQVLVNLTNHSNNHRGIDDGEYIWNVECNDSANTRVWAEDTNRTFTIDTLAPIDIKFITSNNTISTDTTPLIKWNQTAEINFDEYEVLVSTSFSAFDANVVQTKSVSGITNKATTLSELATKTQYYMKVRAVDLASNVKNTTTILWYAVDTNIPVITLNTPENNTFSNDNTQDFNVTVVDDNPDTCILWLSNSSGADVVINKTRTSIPNATEFNVTVTSAMKDGAYKWNIECNDSINNRVNVSTSLLDLTIDTTSPSTPNITSTWHQTNNTDKTPTLLWSTSIETNFERYFIEARKVSDNSLEFSTNVTTRTLNQVVLNLTAGITYNFSVTTYDLAGNVNKSVNTTDLWYYVDEVCGTLAAGWNLCGATWVSAKNLSLIGQETSATFVTVWNESHEWATCIPGVSPNNCDIKIGINNSLITHAWVYVDSETEWRNRTWVATQADANITLTNKSNGWNIIPGEFRNGRNFWQLGDDDFTINNVTMFSIPYINGSVASFVNKPPFNAMSVNKTVFEYGKAMWVFYNGTGFATKISSNSTFDVGSW